MVAISFLRMRQGKHKEEVLDQYTDPLKIVATLPFPSFVFPFSSLILPPSAFSYPPLSIDYFIQ